MRSKDWILITIYVAAAIIGNLLTFSRDNGGNAYIYVSGQLYGVYPLSESEDIIIESEDGIRNDIRIDDGSIYMKDATCPYRECVRTGRISRDGETICCLPAKVMVVVRSEEEALYDAITK